jgi:hypothetical protein
VLERTGCEEGEARDLAIEVLESIGDGAVRLVCVTKSSPPEGLREVCEEREVALVAIDQPDLVDRLRAVLHEPWPT